MTCSELLSQVHNNDIKLPYMTTSSLSEALTKLNKVEFTDYIVNPKEIRFEGDQIHIGHSETIKLTSPVMDQFMKMTDLKKSVLSSLGDEKFIESLNFVFNERAKFNDPLILRTTDGHGYSVSKQVNRRFNPVTHRHFLNEVADILEKEFTQDELFRIDIGDHGLKMTATHPTKEFTVRGRDIQREGLELRNNDFSNKYSYHYHLLRTSCTNSTVFPKFFADERDSNEGSAGFSRFLRDAVRMFDQGKDFKVAYEHMMDTPLSIDTFDEAFKTIKRASKKDAYKILHPYLIPDLVNETVVYNVEKIKESKEFDLFNDLTHYSKSSHMKIKEKAQEFAGDMILNILKQNRSIRLG